MLPDPYVTLPTASPAKSTWPPFVIAIVWFAGFELDAVALNVSALGDNTICAGTTACETANVTVIVCGEFPAFDDVTGNDAE